MAPISPSARRRPSTRARSPDWLQHLRDSKAIAPSAGISAEDVDLNSIEATRTPDIQFVRPAQHDHPLTLYACYSPAGTCIVIKRWLETNIGRGIDSRLGIVRCEQLKLHEIEGKQSTFGTLILLDHAAYIANSDNDDQTTLSILALLIPKTHYVRYFYSILPFATLLHELEAMRNEDNRPFISFDKSVEPFTGSSHRITDRRGPNQPDRHCRLFVYIRETFERALKVPDAPDYLNAISMTDYAPDITDPDTAAERLAKNKWLWENPWKPPENLGDEMQKEGVEITVSDDRYLEYLHPVERDVALAMELKASEYMLVKRVFFAQFYQDVMRTDKKEGDKIKTDHAHQQWLEKLYSWSFRKAKRLVVSWRELGLLDEDKMMPWIHEGGMLEVSMQKREDEDEDDEGDGNNAVKTKANASKISEM